MTSDAGDLSNRDLVRAWEAALGEAGYDVAHSEGRRNSSFISIAAPLPQGMTSDFELADIYLEEIADPPTVLAAVAPCLPPGIEALCVSEVGVDAPSLQSRLRWAEYEVTMSRDTAPTDIESRIAALLDARALPSEYVRTNRVKSYDLRPLVQSIEVSRDSRDSLVIEMRLRAEQDRTARADQVLLALGIVEPADIRRTRLEVEEVNSALLAHRRAGAPDGSEA